MAALRWTSSLALLCLFGTAWTLPAPAPESDMDKDLTEYLERTLKDFRVQMPHGLPDLDIPPLDPFTVDNHHLIFNMTLADIDLKLPHAKIVGLSTFAMKRLHVNVKQLLIDFHMCFDEIKATGHYDLDGLIAKLFPVYGNGSFVVHSHHPDIALILQLEVGAEEINLRIRSLKIDWSELNLDLKNFIGGGEVSTLLHRIVPVLAKRLLITFNPEVVQVLEKGLNGFLAEQMKKPVVQQMLHKILQQSLG